MAEICLVSMPFVALERPSIGLGQLLASATRDGLEARAWYPAFDFARQIGLPLYRAIADRGDVAELVGEWVFAGAAFPDAAAEDGEYLAWALREDWFTVRQYRELLGASADLSALLRRARASGREFVDRLAQTLLAHRPRIVGCSSTFQQHCASLALLRRLKALDAGIVTLLGGANCEGAMAAVTVRAFPWVDYAVSGEADLLFPRLCRLALEHGPAIPAGALPPSVAHARRPATSRAGAGPAVTRETVGALDALPVPDYAEFFAAFARHGDLGLEPLRLLIETSRGCWYGQQRHCTFCGLNGEGMAFRAKSAGRVVGELEALSNRYGVREFEAVDNILDMRFFKSLLPALAAEAPPRYALFFETKSNLHEDHVALLAAAGVRRIQPGIESFHDGALRLIDKGNRAAHNIALLKFAQEHGVALSYNLLFGIPGERDEWYAEMARFLPRLIHLEPPSAVVRVRYDRFSPYHREPARFGIHLQPNRAYHHVYPLSPPELEDLAYFFEDYGQPGRGSFEAPGLRGVWELCTAWRDAHLRHARGGTGSMLMMVEEDGETTLLDRRPGARREMVELRGLPHRVHAACRQPRPRAAVHESLADTLPGLVDEAIAELEAGEFLVETGGLLVAVAPCATTALIASTR